MTDLLISILCSSFLFVCFRLFTRFNVDTTHAIVVNYFTAFVCGCIVQGEIPSTQGLLDGQLIAWAPICGFLFISLFIGMGLSSQKNGVGTTAVAVKMSLALTTLFFTLYYGESWNWLKITGIVIALYSIWMISAEKRGSTHKTGLTWLIILFVGTAVMDATLNYVRHNSLGSYPLSMFSAWSFLFAGILGVIWLTIKSFSARRKISFRSIVGGVVLGIPNYFSIFLLLKAYKTTGWTNAIVLSVAGISVTALTAIVGMLIFNESTGKKKLLGLLMATLAILLLTLGRN